MLKPKEDFISSYKNKQSHMYDIQPVRCSVDLQHISKNIQQTLTCSTVNERELLLLWRMLYKDWYYRFLYSVGHRGGYRVRTNPSLVRLKRMAKTTSNAMRCRLE